MAWRTVGTSNEDMCTKLRNHEILTPDLFDAFMNVDRGMFAFGVGEDSVGVDRYLLIFSYCIVSFDSVVVYWY